MWRCPTVTSFRRAALGILLGFACVAHARDLPAETARLRNYFELPELTSPRVAPKGDAIAFLARAGDATGVGVYDLKTDKFQVIGRSATTQPYQFWWKDDRRLLVHVVRDGESGLIALDRDGGKEEDLWRLASIGHVLDALPEEPGHILMTVPDFTSSSVVKVRMSDGHVKTIEPELPHVYAWVRDAAGNIRAASGGTSGTGWYMLWKPVGATTWQREKLASRDALVPLAFASDPRFLFVMDGTQGDERVVVRLDTQTGEKSVVMHRPGFDPTDTLRFGARRIMIGASYIHLADNPTRCVDPAFDAVVAAFTSKFAGFRVNPIDRLAASRQWLLEISNSRNVGTYVVLNVETGGLAMVGTATGARLKKETLASAEHFECRSRTGHVVTGIVWRTRSQPAAPLIVIAPSSLGDPPAVDAYDPHVQALAGSGFAVAKINVRGTDGFGHAHRAGAESNPEKSMREDLEDAVAHLVAHKGVDAKRVALVGRDTGAIHALAVAASSTRFAAVVNVNARVDFPSDVLKKEHWPRETAPKCRMPVLHLYNSEPDQPETLGTEGQALRKVLARSGAPHRFDIALPIHSKGRLIGAVTSDHAALTARMVLFLRETM